MTSYLDEFVRFSRSPELLSLRLFPNAKETLVRAYRSTDICAGKTELRIAWGKKLARVVGRYGWKTLERMTTAQITAAVAGYHGVCVRHVRCHESNRWGVYSCAHVHVRTCKGKRT